MTLNSDPESNVILVFRPDRTVEHLCVRNVDSPCSKPNAVGGESISLRRGGSAQGCAPAGHSLIIIYHNIIILKLTAALFVKRLIYRRATNRV